MMKIVMPMANCAPFVEYNTLETIISIIVISFV